MESIWSKERPRILKERMSLPDTAEVVIIGGGMAGLLCAFLLKEAGIHAIVLEAATICGGQTERTTAKITSQHGLIYDKLTKEFGETTASYFGQMNQRAIDEYERIIMEKNINCGFARMPAYLYTLEENGTEKLERERTAAVKAGIPASIVYETKLPFPVRQALKYENQAQFHPLKFLKGIVGELEIYENTKVIRLEEKRVVTEHGGILAEKIVIATHFPFVNIPGLYFARMHQERSYVIALGTGEKTGAGGDARNGGQTWELDGMYYGIDADGLSLRNGENCILLGGKSHRTGKNQAENPYEALRREAGKLFPETKEVASWSAQDCMTLDALPYIGVFSKLRPNWYVATGFEKWGMTRSMIAAMAIRDLITGRSDPAWEILSPQRKFTVMAFGNLLKELGNTVANFVTIRRPRCPHLGCRLIWNPYEKTWDCPCHGSRFRENGAVLDNPAQNGMDGT